MLKFSNMHTYYTYCKKKFNNRKKKNIQNILLSAEINIEISKEKTNTLTHPSIEQITAVKILKVYVYGSNKKKEHIF